MTTCARCGQDKPDDDFNLSQWAGGLPRVGEIVFCRDCESQDGSPDPGAPNSWFAALLEPGDMFYGALQNEDGAPAPMWRPCLQIGSRRLQLITAMTSKEEAEHFIRTEVLGAALDDS